MAAVRFLVVAPRAPWPPRSGSAIRIASTIRALGAMGDVDLLSLSFEGPFGMLPVPVGEPVLTWRGARVAIRHSGPATRARLMLGRLPRALAVRDHAAIRADLAAWVVEYDAVWLCRVQSLVAVAPVLDGPFVVDLDDLEAVKIAVELRCAESDGAGSGDGVVRHRLETLAMRWDARRWDRLQRRTARAAVVAVVASVEDRRGLGVRGVEVLPNTYPVPDEPLGRVTVARPPVVSFIGLLTYPPNRDAVLHLSRDIVPRVRARDAAVEFRVVGRHDGRLPGVCPDLTFVGPVDAVEPELARADVVAVPVRYGSGTRVKILEAFAHRVPVVSTRLGAHGLDVRDGEHLLLADDPEAFASACERLLHDVDLRRRLVEAAHRLWRDHHSEAAFQQRVEEVVRRAVAARGPTSGIGQAGSGSSVDDAASS